MEESGEMRGMRVKESGEGEGWRSVMKESGGL